jgi:hypothetical protein
MNLKRRLDRLEETSGPDRTERLLPIMIVPGVDPDPPERFPTEEVAREWMAAQEKSVASTVVFFHAPPDHVKAQSRRA